MNDDKKIINDNKNKNNITPNLEVEEPNSLSIYEQLKGEEDQIDNEQRKYLCEGVEKLAQKENALTDLNDNEYESTTRINLKDQKKNLLLQK